MIHCKHQRNKPIAATQAIEAYTRMPATLMVMVIVALCSSEAKLYFMITSDNHILLPREFLDFCNYILVTIYIFHCKIQVYFTLISFFNIYLYFVYYKK